ncbi:uncharacterized protein LOC114320347 [Camellia sinensis]|uniref:uncharacterized protein LOC114320347 n=1 Tax=Camellia sinensis TaxID=4442 RepID=UPI0010359884|nr:uncharacterized protein LOC114320347 [Camellia sinensis]
MEEYLSKIKVIVSQLALASVIIDDKDLVLITLNGLPLEYDVFSTTVLSQKKYAQDIILKASMLDCKACSSPISVKPGLPAHSDEPFANPSVYRNIVGALQYLTITRPDISFAVNQLCQHMYNPTVGHYVGIKRLLRFIKGIISHGLTYNPSSFDLHAYSDSNWARDSVDRKSTSRFSYLKDKLMSLSPSISLQGNVEDTPPANLATSSASLGCSRNSKLQLLPQLQPQLSAKTF